MTDEELHDKTSIKNYKYEYTSYRASTKLGICSLIEVVAHLKKNSTAKTKLQSCAIKYSKEQRTINKLVKLWVKSNVYS